MKVVFALLLSLWLSTTLLAQETSKSHAIVEGFVTKDPDSQPVKKVLIELIAEDQSKAGDYTAITGADGTFRIEGVQPGRYHLFAERTGFLDSEKQHGRSDGRLLTLTAGQELQDIHIRLQAAAVVRGRVSDEDGEPMADAQVTVLRSTFVGGRSRWEPAGADQTNDLGEYRIANLPAGNFYVSVNPPPDFKSLIENAGKAGEKNNKPDKPAPTTYQASYYPGTPDRSQASSIQLHAGDDFPVNFSLMPSPSLSIRGTVVNLPPRASATIMLQSRDFSVMVNGAEIRKDGGFIIRDVSPGNYTIVASVEGSSVPMTARQTIQVGSTNVDGLRLAPQPGALIRGHLRLESNGSSTRFDPEQIFLTLHSMEAGDDDHVFSMAENLTNLAHVARDGSFEWSDVPSGNYYVQLTGNRGANEDWFLKSVLQSGRETNDSGITVNGGTITLDVVASASGGAIDGVAANRRGEPVANAVIVAVPETRLRGRVDRYRQTVSDQSGHFTLHGLPAGEYTVYAWETVDGDAYYNPEFLKAFEGNGTALHLSEGDRKSVQVAISDEP